MTDLVIPAKAGTSGPEVPARPLGVPVIGVPAKYYLAGCPFAGVTP
jgi:hypothetical protein